MSTSKELKPHLYYYIRRGWYQSLDKYCEDALGRKGKDPLTVFWKAFALGMLGRNKECISLLESFHSRKDMQYPVAVALLYFRQNSNIVDYEAIESLRAELSVAEDVTKEAGMILAARFNLYTKKYDEATRIAQKLNHSTQNQQSKFGGDDAPSSAFELEAFCIEHWCIVDRIQNSSAIDLSSEERMKLQNIDRTFQGKNASQFDLEMLMLWASSRTIISQQATAAFDVINILNQIIAVYPWFLPALADKTLLLASEGEWDQALDTAQRLLDGDADNLDALKIIAVHSFTQESQPHDAVQKLEDYDNAVQMRETSSVEISLESSALFSNICSRQPRALQICVRMLERVLKQIGTSISPIDEARIYCQIGYINIMQGPGQYEKAMKSFREAIRKDQNNIKALEGMITCQLYEGSFEDAESQIELLTLMHNAEELGYEFAYIQTLLLRGKNDSKKHISALDSCMDAFLQSGSRQKYDDQSITNHYIRTYLNSFQNFLSSSPDFTMLLASDYLSHTDASMSSSYIPSTSSLLNGNSLKDQLNGQESMQTVWGNNNNMTVAGGGNYGTVYNNTVGATMMGTTMGGMQTMNTDLSLFTSSNINQGSSSSSNNSSSDITPAMQSGMDLINSVLRICPGMISPYVELARCYSSIGLYDEASRCLHKCLSMQPQCSPVLVALAKVEAGRFNTVTADRILEQALSSDFSIRSAPLFKLVKSYVRAQQGRLDEAIAEIEQLLVATEVGFTIGGTANNNAESKSDGISQLPNTQNFSGNYSDSLRLTRDDRVSSFVTYSSLLSRSRRLKEANRVLSQAKVIFAGSNQEVQILVASSQLSVEKNDYDTAIRMLDKILPESPIYSKAQILKADILLNNNHDKEGFTKTYQKLAEQEPTSKNYALLGEAYLRILNPEAAIDALEKAYKLDPQNGRLRGRIGRALVSTHEYHRAVEFYESAIREVSKASSNNANISNDLINLSHDLAKLYIKLGRTESSSRVLSNILHEYPNDSLSLRQDVTTLLLLTRVQSTIDPAEVLNTLLTAFRLQKELITKLRSGAISSSDVLEKEKQVLSDICERIGVCYIDNGENQSAEQMFNDSVQQNPQNTKAMLGLSKLYFGRGDKDSCRAQCNKIISADLSSSEEASMLLSEVLFQSIATSVSTDEGQMATALENVESAPMKPLIDFLKRQPNNYLVLEKLLSLLRRAGKLDEAVEFIKAATVGDPRHLSHAGFHFCQGLYSQYTNDVGKAISEFNLARKDEFWGSAALTHMIELYLNPDQEGAWEEKESGPLDEGTRANIAAAEELLKELRPKAKDLLRVKILENYCFLATRSKNNVDRAMMSFSEMLDKDPDYLPAVLGMSTGFMIEKNQHKARNLLKRVGKMEMSNHDGEDFEKANLLLAKFYIDKAKNDLAQELCKRTLVHNKSCSQAWEILGLIMEKDSNYELAADCYEKAWKLEFEASASVGFKLAFSYLKCRKFVDSIDICEKVLDQYPDYPRISEEILKKAQHSIRTA
eukprot:gene4303-6099_t